MYSTKLMLTVPCSNQKFEILSRSNYKGKKLEKLWNDRGPNSSRSLCCLPTVNAINSHYALENFESVFQKSEKTAGFGVVFGLFSAEWIYAAKVTTGTDEA